MERTIQDNNMYAEKEQEFVSQAEVNANWIAAVLCGFVICYLSEEPDGIFSWIWLSLKCLVGGFLSGMAVLWVFGCCIWPNIVLYVWRIPLSPDPVLRTDECYGLLFPESDEADRVARRVSCEVDHLVYTCAKLDEGIEAIYELTDVRAEYGGKHPAWGTHNAVLSLGGCAYLEIIAPDPDRADPNMPVTLFGLDDDANLDKLVAFAVHPNPATKGATMELIAQSIQFTRGNPGKISTGERVQPTGTMLRWKLTSPCEAIGSKPFVIDWMGSTNPATTAPKGCKIRKLTVFESNAVDERETRDFFKCIGLIQNFVEKTDELQMPAFPGGHHSLECSYKAPLTEAGRVKVQVKETVGPSYMVVKLDSPKGTICFS